MSDERKFICTYCDMPCTLIMEGMGVRDDEEIKLVACPYDGSRHNKWEEVKKE